MWVNTFGFRVLSRCPSSTSRKTVLVLQTTLRTSRTVVKVQTAFFYFSKLTFFIHLIILSLLKTLCNITYGVHIIMYVWGIFELQDVSPQGRRLSPKSVHKVEGEGKKIGIFLFSFVLEFSQRS